MDNLEKYIDDHRAAFDDAVPSLKVWAAIDKQLAAGQDQSPDAPKGRVRSLWRKLIVAASVLLVLTAGIFIGKNLNTGSAALANQELMEEVDDLRHYYEREINQKQAQLVRYNESKAIDPDLAQIDEQIQELMEELAEVPEEDEEKVINAMVYNYQVKIAILEKVLREIEHKKEKTIKNSDNEINI